MARRDRTGIGAVQLVSCGADAGRGPLEVGEARVAFALNENRYNEKIIPLLHKPCKYSRLSWTLGEFEFPEFAGDFEQGCKNLLRVWGIKYKAETRLSRATKRATKSRRKQS